jgi:hypothetical protein
MGGIFAKKFNPTTQGIFSEIWGISVHSGAGWVANLVANFWVALL